MQYYEKTEKILNDDFIEFCQIEHFYRFRCDCLIFKRFDYINYDFNIKGKFSKIFY